MKKNSAYVDTGAFIAFLDRSDSHHDLFARLFANPPPLLTSSLVLAEGHAWFLRRYDASRGLQFAALIEELPSLSIASVGHKEIAAATSYLRKFQDQKLTLADAMGLYLIDSQKLKVVWSTDRHLGLTGVEIVINQK